MSNIHVPWQGQVATNRVRPRYGIAIGPNLFDGVPIDTAAAAVPLGGQIVWPSGLTPINLYFTEDAFNIVPVEDNPIPIDPPTAPGKIAKIRDKVGVDHIEINSLEVGAKLYAYTTNSEAVATRTWKHKAVHSRVSVALELHGLQVQLFPSCEIVARPIEQGTRQVATQQFMIDVFAVDMGETLGVVTDYEIEYGG